MNIIIIGAGAAGCFAAIELKRRLGDADITVLERGHKALAKVAITGGGRCNLTNSFAKVRSMEQVYPRGHGLMKKLLHHFSNTDVMEWFEDEGVALVTQDDECVFPASQDAMQIVETLTSLMRRLGVKLITDSAVSNITKAEQGYDITTSDTTYRADKVVVCIGGQPRQRGFDLLKDMDIDIIEPVPSLFTFCIDDRQLTALTGTVVENALVTLTGTKIKGEGPLLITHRGISGPATLKLSARAARVLAEREYKDVDISINWLYGREGDDIMRELHNMALSNGRKMTASVYPQELNARLWRHLLAKAAIPADMRWAEIGGKSMNRLHNVLTNDIYRITGQNKHKEEFVTAGGVALSNLKHSTLEAKNYPGLYFAGEVTDVDAVTGGFNLQAAWTMGYVVAQSIAME